MNSIQLNIRSKPWREKHPPRRVLAIRLQAMGDVVITLPYLQSLREQLPAATRLDLLTREETEGIPRNIRLFDKVHTIGGQRNHKKQILFTLLLLPRLLFQRYDVIIDMQNNRISGIVRAILRPKAWVVFDKFSPVSAAERYQRTIETAGLGPIQGSYRLQLKNPEEGLQMLRRHNWSEGDELVVLNPAGAFTTRNWPLDHYVAFARLWLRQFPHARFLILGTSFIASKADDLQQQLGDKLINLVGQTTTEEAFSILQHARLMLSEDSGLMHMAWISGIPTFALFGSTRSDWSRPVGDHTFLLDSSDLPCGNCMLEKCIFGDVRCLTRHSADEVFHHAVRLLSKVEFPHESQ